MDYPDRQRSKKIRKTLKTLLEQKKHCPNCGGLVPELSFLMDGKEFLFVCHAIVQRESWTWDAQKEIHTPQKTLAQTDYKQFAKYCAKKE